LSSIADVFTELFYGAGAWLGILLFLAIIIGLAFANKYVGVLMLPVCIFLAINYLAYPTLLWHAAIMFICAIFIVIHLMMERDK
jgi:hypothetical protein